MTYLTKSALNSLTYQIVGAAIDVHKALGPGLLESTYHECMKIALTERKLFVESELIVPIEFHGHQLSTVLRCDLLVERAIVVELKSVFEILPLFEAQLLTYMKLLKVAKGILINFNCSHLYSEGQRTYVNDLFQKLPR